jgi:hypothetical protein
MESVNLYLMLLFGLQSVLAISFYFKVACTNPGYIMGSEEDVEKRAGAYNPKDY